MSKLHSRWRSTLVQAQQQKHGSFEQYQRLGQSAVTGDALGPQETAFISQRDSFYMASVSETGWPYMQHRGGPKGFLHVLSPSLLGFADLRGNRQYVSVGNLQHDDRVALFLMDYPHQTRLKILGHAEIHEGDAKAAELLPQLNPNERNSIPERIILIRVEGFDWNCPQHITPRFTAEDLQEALAPVQQKIAALEAENEELRSKLAELTATVSD